MTSDWRTETLTLAQLRAKGYFIFALSPHCNELIRLYNAGLSPEHLTTELEERTTTFVEENVACFRCGEPANWDYANTSDVEHHTGLTYCHECGDCDGCDECECDGCDTCT